MASGRFYRSDLTVIDPLFNGGVTDTDQICRIFRLYIFHKRIYTKYNNKIKLE